MAWTIEDRFPTWGETGESPPDGFFYEGGDQINEKHLDYLWDNLDALRDDANAALTDIDSDSDGVVDEADALTNGGSLLGDLNAADGETLWDESEGYIPQGRLENTTITLSGGDGLKGGSTAALGGSFSLDIEPADFAGTNLSDDGSDNLQLDISTNVDFSSNNLNSVGTLNANTVDGSTIDASNELGAPSFADLGSLPTAPQGAIAFVQSEDTIYVQVD
jgi:hypothetical protein